MNKSLSSRLFSVCLYLCSILLFSFSRFSVLSIKTASAVSLPDTYDLRKEQLITPVKDQKNTGCCWSFATLKSLESNLIKKEPAPTEQIDLSENHLAWFLYHPDRNTKSPVYLDGINFQKKAAKKNYLKKPVSFRKKYSFESYCHSLAYRNGGNALFSAAVLASWSGAVSEKTAPFTAGTEKKLMQMGIRMNRLSEKLRGRSEYMLTDAICYDSADRTAVKTAILTYGALEASFYYDKAYLSQPASSSPQHASYYQTKYTEEASLHANHCINIIGWDDHYPKENFSIKPNTEHAINKTEAQSVSNTAEDPSHVPETDGAWLVENSYGTEFGENGCFYVSYCEPSLTDLYSFQGEKRKYDHNYQYDGFGWTLALAPQNENGNKAANLFTVQSKFIQKLQALSFYTATDGQSYTVSVYKEVQKENPESGRKVFTCSGKFPYRGYHTIPLSEEIPLRVNERFSVVLSLPRTSENTGYLPVEGAGQTTGIFHIRFSSAKGESFCCALATDKKTGEKNYRWLDLHQTPVKTSGNPDALLCHNVCIKAFTSNVEYAGDIRFSSRKIILKKGEKRKLKLSVTKTSQKTVTFTNPYKTTAALSILSGNTIMITGKKTGKTLIKAVLPSGAYDKLTVIVK